MSFERSTIILFGALSAAFASAAVPPATRPSSTQPAATQPTMAKIHSFNSPVPGSENGKWKDYAAMHNYFVEGFVNTEGFGLSRMMTPRQSARFNVLYVEGETYRIGTVNLISLGDAPEKGKPTAPYAYEAKNGDPVKSRLKTSQKRELTKQEVTALAKLEKGEESILQVDEKNPMLIGALRASASCVECHHVKEGTLLGAFSYPLISVEEPSSPRKSPVKK